MEHAHARRDGAGGGGQRLDRRGQTRPDTHLLVIVGGTLIDGTGDAPRSNDAILLENGRIKMMGPEALRKAPREARVVTATDQWIVPGFIDGHVHFFQTGGLDARPDMVPDPEGRSYVAIVDAIRRKPQAYLRSYVCAGVTSVVDFGGPSWIFDLRSSREDDPLAPRIAFAGPLLATFDPKPLELENDEPLWLMKDDAGVAAQVEKLATMKTDFVKIWWVNRSGTISSLRSVWFARRSPPRTGESCAPPCTPRRTRRRRSPSRPVRTSSCTASRTRSVRRSSRPLSPGR